MCKIYCLLRMSCFVFLCVISFSVIYILFLKQVVTGQKPTLLWWTKEIFPHVSEEKVLISCGNVQCYSTKDRGKLHDEDTRGIMFYGTGINPSDLPLPRSPQHEWCLFHEESPLNNFILSHETFIQLFNHTATFKRESDYPITTQDFYALDYLIDKQPIDIKEKNTRRKIDRYAPLLYAQSHDDVPSYRDTYVKELMKYIDVDSYGLCLHNKDLPKSLTNAAESFQKDQFLDFIANYKFHLSFENAVCDDYMTEKLTRPLHVGSVPVYYGSSKAQDWMPTNQSIIMVSDFRSPKELADYINYLDENDEEYLKFLDFKKPNGITNTFLTDTLNNRDWGSHDYKYYVYNIEDKKDYYQGFECYVCNEIHKRMKAEKEHTVNPSQPKPQPKMANNSHLGCPKPFSPLKDHEMPPTHWEFTYEDTKTVAEAVVEMLIHGEKDRSLTKMYYQKILKKKSSHRADEL